ncbi:NPC intracellular cholesterol transporter 2 homolog a-like [Pogonomyrmex barbatus]|uniref:NPC intracellular cholesterol transporter 2 homolog a-like n=1 Tax=Pogonomyrmex barbatus TaxID=144034 RepID=A0A6I9VT32_9HYME|nr:NPC intracellular cholesterol transporter 2 homolog a-like [Pogonomyrmex barbatus]
MTRISFAISLLYVLHCVTSSFAFVFEDCGSEVGKFTDIVISSCTTADEKCAVARGSEVSVVVKFVPNVDVSDVEAHAFGVILDVPVPFPLEKPKVCKEPSSGLKCPLKKDVEAEYKATFTVEKKAPALSVDVMWEFRNEKDEKIICIKFPAKIT